LPNPVHYLVTGTFLIIICLILVKTWPVSGQYHMNTPVSVWPIKFNT
jgi:hypothetical protein